MMLACNSLPNVICGYVENPQDAFLFGRINNGNAVSIPLGLNFGEIQPESALHSPIATPFVICLFNRIYTITAGAAVNAITANCTA